jgi:hypothetical protein
MPTIFVRNGGAGGLFYVCAACLLARANAESETDAPGPAIVIRMEG